MVERIPTSNSKTGSVNAVGINNKDFLKKQNEKNQLNELPEKLANSAKKETKQLDPSITKVKEIKYAGYYHYAKLYVDAEGKPFAVESEDFKQLMNILKNEGIPKEGTQRVLRTEINLPNGKKAKIADDIDAESMKLRTKAGGPNIDTTKGKNHDESKGLDIKF